MYCTWEFCSHSLSPVTAPSYMTIFSAQFVRDAGRHFCIKRIRLHTNCNCRYQKFFQFDWNRSVNFPLTFHAFDRFFISYSIISTHAYNVYAVSIIILLVASQPILCSICFRLIAFLWLPPRSIAPALTTQFKYILHVT